MRSGTLGRLVWLGVCTVALFLVGADGGRSALASHYIELGRADGLALDQPRVAIEVIDVSEGGEPVSLGPDLSNTFLLDTGANAILAVGTAVSELTQAGYQTVATYDEQGVAGTTPMGVSESYRFDFAADSGTRHTLPDVRLLSNGSLNFGSFNGILGMPAMVGRTTTLDMSIWTDPFPLFMGVDFSVEPPPDTGHRYTVPLTLVDFPRKGRRHGHDPLPTWAPLPSAPVAVRHGQEQVRHEMLVDTGAQMTILNSSTAFALGLDADGSGSFDEEKIDDLPVGGIGGTINAPVLAVDSLRLATEERVDLVWTDLNVAVIDIDPAISGVLGMDLLTSGWFEKFLLGTGPDGYVQQIHFDFRESHDMTGAMRIDITPTLDVVRFESVPGDMNDDGWVDFDDLAPWVLALTDEAAYTAALGIEPTANGDLDGSGTFDFDDIGPFVAMLTSGPSARSQGAVIPEPCTLQLSAVGALLAAALGRRRRSA